MRRPTLSDVSSLGLLACALVITTVVVRREFRAGLKPSAPSRMVISGPQLSLVGRRIGSAEAPVTIVVFGDFQCPFCARAQAVLDSLHVALPGQSSVLYRHLPLETLHPHAWTAALASECAADQERFVEMHDLLYRIQDSIGRIAWRALAERARVDKLDEFESCLDQERFRDAIERDVLLARSIELRGTPAFIIGGELVEGVPTLQWLKTRVEKAVKLTDGR